MVTAECPRQARPHPWTSGQSSSRDRCCVSVRTDHHRIAPSLRALLQLTPLSNADRTTRNRIYQGHLRKHSSALGESSPTTSLSQPSSFLHQYEVAAASNRCPCSLLPVAKLSPRLRTLITLQLLVFGPGLSVFRSPSPSLPTHTALFHRTRTFILVVPPPGLPTSLQRTSGLPARRQGV